MENKPLKFINTSLIIILIIVINLGFFLIYYFAYPDIPFWKKLWEYLGSAAFTLVTGSLIIPLLLSILEKRYKFMENLQRQREEKRKQLEEQRRLSRRETINDTISMWQELYGLSSELIYFEPDKASKASINQLIIRLIKFPSQAEVTVNKWGHQFPNLKDQDNDVFLHFVNIVYQSSLSIALFIQRDIDKKQRIELQNMLYLILDQVKTIVHHKMIDIFKYSAELLELQEENAGQDLIDKKQESIAAYMNYLRDWADGLAEQDDLHDNFLAPSEGPMIEEIRQTARKIEKWLKEDKSRQVYQSEHFNELQQKFYNISLEDRVSSASIPYTIEYIKAIADWLSFESACMYIYNRTHKIW